MAKDTGGDDGLNEASLDDFFQPPTDEDGAVVDADLFEAPPPVAAPTKSPAAKTQTPAAKKSKPKLEDHEAVMPLDENVPPPAAAAPRPPAPHEQEADVQDLFGDTGDRSSGGGEEEPETLTAVEELNFTDGTPDKDKKKKILIIAGAAVAILLLLGVGFLFFGGSTPPPPPAPAPRPPQAKAPPPQSKAEAPPVAADPFPGPFAQLGDLDHTPKGTNAQARSIFDKEGKPDSKGREALPQPAKKQFFSLYFGTYVVPKHLEAAKEKLRQWELKPVQRASTARVEMVRLKVAELGDRPAADRLMNELKGKGFDAFVIKMPGKKYPVYAGSFFTTEKYGEYSSKLTQNGYPPGEQERFQMDRKVYELWGGDFKTLADADPVIEKILKAAWNPRIYLAD